MIVHINNNKIKKVFWNGGSEIHFVFAKGYKIDDVNNLVGMDNHASYTVDFSRRRIRHKEWELLNLPIDPDWGVN